MISAHFLLLVVAVILWFCSGVMGIVRNPPYAPHLGWFGMFFWGLSMLVR
jgi:hypothetical protein